MPSDTRNVKLGVCSVTFDGVDLGYTKGGVEITVATETKKVQVDQFGNAPINEYIIGRTCVAKVPLAETTLEILARIMPGSTLIGTGGVKATGSITYTTSAPVTTDAIIVNGVAFTFKTVPVGSNDMPIPATFGAAATALIAKINACVDPAVSQITASAGAAGVVSITADNAGTAGNNVTIAKTGSTNAVIVGMTGGVDYTSKKVEVPNGVGQSLLALSKKLVFHPQALAQTDRSEDFTMPLAMTPGAMNFAYKLDDERIYNVEFSGYPDSTTRLLFVVGDEAAVAA